MPEKSTQGNSPFRVHMFYCQTVSFAGPTAMLGRAPSGGEFLVTTRPPSVTPCFPSYVVTHTLASGGARCSPLPGQCYSMLFDDAHSRAGRMRTGLSRPVRMTSRRLRRFVDCGRDVHSNRATSYHCAPADTTDGCGETLTPCYPGRIHPSLCTDLINI